jgi:hypothetical protein
VLSLIVCTIFVVFEVAILLNKYLCVFIIVGVMTLEALFTGAFVFLSLLCITERLGLHIMIDRLCSHWLFLQYLLYLRLPFLLTSTCVS